MVAVAATRRLVSAAIAITAVGLSIVIDGIDHSSGTGMSAAERLTFVCPGECLSGATAVVANGDGYDRHHVGTLDPEWAVWIFGSV